MFQDDDTSNLRDLICSPSDYSWGAADNGPVNLTPEEAAERFPDTAATWLCAGAVLRLEEADSPANLPLFRFNWRHGQPVIFADLGGRLNPKLWTPDVFAVVPDHGFDPANPDSSAVTNSQTLKKFFDGLDDVKRRPLGDNGEPMHLKLRENWPVAEDQFLELLPNQLKDVLKHLPLKEYTDREGVLNLASRLPDCFVRLDLGPRLWGGYVKSTYPLQYNMTDSLHLCVHTGTDGREDVLKQLDAAQCDSSSVEYARQAPGRVAALWQVFHPEHADKLKAFILKNCKSDGKGGKPKDPLIEQTMYLKERHLKMLSDEEGIKPWVFVQLEGEGVMIPAGSPFQVKLVQSSLFVQTEFVSPEHIVHAINISNSDLQLQVKNLVFHACKDALAVLYNPENKK